ncbi:hypothetical protein ACGE24_09130 [Corynebacterium kroppenstedtii]|uniref:hypothetical protein n=1 Tax=Corynebacterium sp. PCR 32 TaxID=3351342 RepID=UPI0030AA88CC
MIIHRYTRRQVGSFGARGSHEVSMITLGRCLPHKGPVSMSHGRPYDSVAGTADSRHPDIGKPTTSLPPFTGGFPEERIAHDEKLLVDVHSKRSTLIFPVLETILISGIIWAIIGMIDGAAGPFAGGGFRGIRQIIMGAWVLAVAWFFARPMMRWWRRRLVITNYRVVARFATNDIVDIPVNHITGVHRRRATLIFDVYRMPPLVVNNVAKARRTKRVIDRCLRHQW